MICFNVIVLLACATLIVQGAELPSAVGALCGGKKISLTSKSDLLALNQQIGQPDESAPETCVEKTKRAIRDLTVIVGDDPIKQCTMEAYEQYKAFYVEYLDRSNKETNKRRVKLPQQLRDFALAYGLQFSALCRVNMVKVLLNDATNAVKPEHFDGIKELIEPTSPVAAVLGCPQKRPDLLMLPSDMAEVEGKQQQPKVKIDFNHQTAPFIKNIQVLCERQFEPVYGPLMLPVSRLANLGFEYRSRELADIIKAALKSDKTSDVIGRWSRVAFVCETFNQIEIVEESEDAKVAEGTDTTRVMVLTKDDARNKEKDTPADRKNLLEGLQASNGQIEPSTFKPNLSVTIPEIILSKEIKKALSSVKTSKSERDNIRVRYLSGMWKRIGHVWRNSGASDSYYKLAKKMKDGETMDIGTEIVKSLNQLVDEQTNLDKPVNMATGVTIALLFCGSFLAVIAFFAAALGLHFVAFYLHDVYVSRG